MLISPEYAWLLERLGALADAGHSGEVRILFKHGVPKRLDPGAAEFPPPPPCPDSDACPVCSSKMDVSDYANLFTCRPCARTWTRSQLRTLRKESRA